MRKILIILTIFIVSKYSVRAQNSYSLDFDGEGDYVEIIDESAMIANADQMTLSGWVYPRNTNSGWPDFDGFFGFRNNNDADFYLIQLDAYKVEGRLRVSGGGEFTIVTAENSISPETWHHLALTYDGSNIILYIDGIETGSAEASGQITNDAVPLNIGRLVWQTTYFDLDGQADEISLWNIALTQQQIHDYMEADLTGETGLVGYWNFNEGSGETANDASENDNHGTIYGATWSTNVPFQQTYLGPVWHVSTTGSDETGDGSEANPLATIQTAIDSSSDGDTVLVAAGTYVENINYNGKSIVVGSHLINFPDSTDFISNTIINGDSVGTCVVINGDSSKLIGFTLRNGFGSDWYASALLIDHANWTEISYCLVIENNGNLSPIIVEGGNSNTLKQLTVFNNVLGYGSPIIWSGPYGNNTLNLINIIGYADYFGGSGYNFFLNVVNNYSGSEPLFCNPDSGDYSLAENSPCVGTGENGANIGAFGVGCGIQVNWDFSLSEPVIEVMGADDEWNPGDTISVEMDFCNNTDVAHNWYPGVTIESDSSLTSLHIGHIWFYAMVADECHAISWVAIANTSIISDTVVTFSAYPEALNCQNQPEYCIDGDTLTFEVPIIVQVVSTEPEYFIPEVFALHQNYPNPFNPVTSLRYNLPENGLVNITIYDMMGRVVKTLVNSSQTAGYKSIRWNATNDLGQPVSAGMYIYTIQAGEFRQTKKMVLLK